MCKGTEEEIQRRLNLPNNKTLSLRLKKPPPLCWRLGVGKAEAGHVASGSTKPAPSPCLLTDGERDRVQKKTFTKWANKHLMKVGPSRAPWPEPVRPPPRWFMLLAAGSS